MTENSLAVERVERGASTVGGTGYSLTGQGARIPQAAQETEQTKSDDNLDF